VVNSCGTTVSSPVGMMAPVMIFTHSPGPTAPCQALPAKAVPITFNASGASLRNCAPSKAKPSIAELSCGGTLIGETTSCASTRSSAAKMLTVSVCLTGSTSFARNAFTSLARRACGS
jgi:hypothetical protein